MIYWGSAGKSVQLGHIEHRHCAACKKEQSFGLLLHYRYAHIYHFFRWVTSKKYSLFCSVCNRDEALGVTDAESKLKKHPIPFMTRYGWVFLIALLVFAYIFAKITR
jgi:hypothetical protein